jgi:hypothetical protein
MDTRAVNPFSAEYMALYMVEFEDYCEWHIGKKFFLSRWFQLRGLYLKCNVKIKLWLAQCGLGRKKISWYVEMYCLGFRMERLVKTRRNLTKDRLIPIWSSNFVSSRKKERASIWHPYFRFSRCRSLFESVVHLHLWGDWRKSRKFTVSVVSLLAENQIRIS